MKVYLTFARTVSAPSKEEEWPGIYPFVVLSTFEAMKVSGKSEGYIVRARPVCEDQLAFYPCRGEGLQHSRGLLVIAKYALPPYFNLSACTQPIRVALLKLRH